MKLINFLINVTLLLFAYKREQTEYRIEKKVEDIL